jgi:hypothetical protein
MKLKLTIDYFIISLILICSRILFLFFTPYAFYNEEAKIGSIGHDIIFHKKLLLPFWGYLDSPHSGGSLFSGLLAIPFYLILGDRYLVLKVTALVFSVLTVFIWHRLISFEFKGKKRFFIFFLLFFTFATPHYLQKSVVLAGNTVELMFFDALAIYYFWRIRNNTIGVFRNHFLLGVICGFSFWIQFMSFYLFLTVIITLFITGVSNKRTVQKVLSILCGFMLGVLPLWIYNVLYKWPSFTADKHAGIHFIFTLTKLKHFLLIDMPASYHFLDVGFIKAQWFGFITYGLFLVTITIHLVNNLMKAHKQVKYCSKTKEEGMSLEMFLILYLFIFIIGTTLTTFPIGSNNVLGWNSMNVHAEYYIVSLQPILFVLLILLNRHTIKYALIVSALVSVIFIVGYLRLFIPLYYNNALLKPLHSTEANAYECGFSFIKNKDLFLEFLTKIPIELRSDYLDGAQGIREEN